MLKGISLFTLKKIVYSTLLRIPTTFREPNENVLKYVATNISQKFNFFCRLRGLCLKCIPFALTNHHRMMNHNCIYCSRVVYVLTKRKTATTTKYKKKDAEYNANRTLGLYTVVLLVVSCRLALCVSK